MNTQHIPWEWDVLSQGADFLENHRTTTCIPSLINKETGKVLSLKIHHVEYQVLWLLFVFFNQNINEQVVVKNLSYEIETFKTIFEEIHFF